MADIATYVFLDLETTCFPHRCNNKTRILEMCLLAVHPQDYSRLESKEEPRVQQKLTMCFRTKEEICQESKWGTGLDEQLLQYESEFDMESFNTINNFINRLQKPVCLIAHNGYKYDFPIIKGEFQRLNVSLSKDIMYVDCLRAFFILLQPENQNTNEQLVVATASDYTAADDQLSDRQSDEMMDQKLKSDSDVDCKEDDNKKKIIDPEINEHTMEEANQDEGSKSNENSYVQSIQQRNESTPLKKSTDVNNSDCVPEITTNKRKMYKICVGNAKKELFSESTMNKGMFYEGYPKPEAGAHKLQNIYYRTVKTPEITPHRAENDCIMALRISLYLGENFVNWVNENCKAFEDVVPLKPGK